MRVVLQQAMRASVSVGGQIVGGFDRPGLVALVGITHDDTREIVEKMARKTWELRIFPEEQSACDLGAPILAVSQFTLYANTRKGRRPSWNQAAPRPVSEPIFRSYVEALGALGAEITTGVFGEHMEVSLINDGPMTIFIDSADWRPLS